MNEDIKNDTFSTQISNEKNEKFRKRLLIVSRVLALFLILSIAYFGYHYYNYNKLLEGVDGNKVCFECGHIYGMSCKYIYFYDFQKLNASEKEKFLLNLGYSNVNQTREQFFGGLPEFKDSNLTNFDVSMNK